MRALLMFFLLLAAGCAELAADEPAPTDSDGDGFSDEAETAAGSDPQDAMSLPNASTERWPTWAPADGALLQPGDPIGWCTFNFLFEGPNNAGYIGTAAHCTDAVGERIPLDGFGEIGTVVFDSGDHTDGVDFTLIQLDPEIVPQAFPQVRNHNGPTGAVTSADLAVGDIIELHGYGTVLGENEVTRDRFGLLVDFDEREYTIDMPAVPGDSGSSLLHQATGKALGIISRFGTDQTPPATDRGPLMPYIFEELENAGYGDVRLVTI